MSSPVFRRNCRFRIDPFTRGGIDLLQDPEILGTKLRTPVKARVADGVGILEAHRGVLFHHYVTDKQGKTTLVLA